MSCETEPLSFVLNGQQYVVSQGLDASYTLAEYLRDHAGLKGTKVTCREGGCGACTVTLTRFDPQRGLERTCAVNSCLVPLYSLHGSSVTTIEGLGGRKQGYHTVQKRIADYHGSQCGYCTPGMVMSLHGCLSERGRHDAGKLEKCLDGNLCRCTGYRPILDAAKSFADVDATSQCEDIEDLTNRTCRKSGNPSSSTSVAYGSDEAYYVKTFLTSSGKWFKTSSLPEVFKLLEKNKSQRTRLVAGNTANGVVKAWADVFIDVQDVSDLNEIKVDRRSVSFGGNVTLSTMIDTCRQVGQDKTGFRYLKDVLAPHMETIGGTSIRNVGSWAGNLMIAHDFSTFPSDLVPAFEAVDAILKIASSTGEVVVTVEEFLAIDMAGKVLISVTLPDLNTNQVYRVIKVKAREASSHTYVTGGFLAEMSSSTKLDSVRIAYVGVRKGLTRARSVEKLLKGKNLKDQQTITAAMEMITKECVADSNPLLCDVNYATRLTSHLLYKFLVHCLADSVDSTLSSSLSLSSRGISTGTQDYQEIPDNFPLNQALPNVQAMQQAAGEIRYTDDLPRQERELFAVLVPSQHAGGRIASINTAKAKALPGVHSVFLAADLKTKRGDAVLAEHRVDYAGQPVAVILAEDERTARRGGRLVDVELTDLETPIMDISEAIDKELFHPTSHQPLSKGDALGALDSCDHVIEGECKMESQYHMYMENQVSLVVPTEEGLDVWCSSQFLTRVQTEVANATGMPVNGVNVSVSQLGGAFGGKIFTPNAFAVITALCASEVDRPVRLSMSLKNCLESTSKRFPFVGKYKVGFNKDGVMQALHMKLFLDCGFKMQRLMDNSLADAMKRLDGAYHCENMLVEGIGVKTHSNPPTAMRAPIHYPDAFTLDSVASRIAHHLRLPEWEVQRRNLIKDGQVNLVGTVMQDCHMNRVFNELNQGVKLDQWQEDVNKFNQNHEWVKRGLATSASLYTLGYNTVTQYPTYIAIYASDGSVAVSHGGVEMGQGIHTKVTQMVSRTLDVPIEKIKVKATNTLTGNNMGPSAGSVTMELVAKSAMDCCVILRDRIQPIREGMAGKSWPEVIAKCFAERVDLSAHSRFVSETKEPYNVYGALATEAEVDILTGERRINRVDLLLDCGESINPAVDVGQIEGALVMGLGHILYEKEVYDPSSGRLLTNSTWEYKPPTSLDIPTRMNIRLLKDTPNKRGVIPSKAIGEPPMCMSAGFLNAVRKAIEASRESRGKPGFVRLDVPATADRVQTLCDVTTNELTIHVCDPV